MKFDVMGFLRSQYAVLAVLVLALLAQMPHAQHVFYVRGHEQNTFAWWQSWGFAIALEIAVLVFVVRGNINVSWGFAAFSIAVNAVYYFESASAVWYMPQASWLLSAGLPVAIALYSHEVSKPHEHASAPEPAQVIAQVEASIDALVVAIECEPLPDDACELTDDAPSMQAEDEPTQVDAELTHAPDAPTCEPTQVDGVAQQILDAIRDGACTPYAISKRTGIAQTTLKRKQGDAYIGRLPQLVAAGHLSNGGTEYRIANG